MKPLRKNHEENVKIMLEELEYQGVSVIIPRRECIQTLNKRMRANSRIKPKKKHRN
jgi:indolepyruvate ferredoxin oxidoreductase, alpha subunit